MIDGVLAAANVFRKVYYAKDINKNSVGTKVLLVEGNTAANELPLRVQIPQIYSYTVVLITVTTCL